MAGSDIKFTHMDGVGASGSGRARLRAYNIYNASSGAARLTLTDGNGGTTLIDQDAPAGTVQGFLHVEIPGDGILFEDDIRVATKTNWTSVNLFWS